MCYLFEDSVFILKQCFQVTTHKINLADREEIRKTADLVKNEVGNPDIVINNAGIVTGMFLILLFEDFLR